ncbi:hypothetical protein TRICHSKD4_0079 [Roseibium sp. TrichSKD4]|nr:hypothetical protein TRICHSKD4_0079 [Roseibium sp. TrichSKD4]
MAAQICLCDSMGVSENGGGDVMRHALLCSAPQNLSKNS